MAASPADGEQFSQGPPPGRAGLGRSVSIFLGAVLVVVAAIGVFLIVRPSRKDAPPPGCGPVRQSFTILSSAMLPALRAGDHVAVVDVKALNRGDIVILRSPDPGQGEEKDVVKRVIALPGETVEATQGHISIDGRPLPEPYLGSGTTTAQFAPSRVPADHYFVLGDNRGNSKDSRFFGPVPRGSIIGVAVSITAPSSRARALTDHCA